MLLLHPLDPPLGRFIIGQKGVGVREMMNNFDVNIRVPSVEQKSDLILISGVPSNVEDANVGFLLLVLPPYSCSYFLPHRSGSWRS